MRPQTKAEIHHRVLLRHGKTKPREPLRTVKELAEMLGMPMQTMGRLLAEPGAPRCEIDNSHGRAVFQARWYAPSKVRAWLADRKGAES